MTAPLRAGLPYLLSLVVVAAACGGDVQASSSSPTLDGTPTSKRASVTIQSPTTGEVVQGVAIIRFRVENVSIASPFLPKEQRRGPLPAGHLHVTVDGAPWHWVHATADPVVVTPLPPGEHTVDLELADADHRPLDVQSVRFTVAARKSPEMSHAAHP
jgi:hypothetical protein